VHREDRALRAVSCGFLSPLTHTLRSFRVQSTPPRWGVQLQVMLGVPGHLPLPKHKSNLQKPMQEPAVLPLGRVPGVGHQDCRQQVPSAN